MPHETMSVMHETGAVVGHHWFFWVAVLAGLAILASLFYFIGTRNKQSNKNRKEDD